MSEIRFEPAEHRYWHGTQEMPSVSRIMDPLTMLDDIPRDVLEAASDVGRKVHSAIDFFDKGVLDFPALDPVLSPYVRAWEKFLEEMGARIIASELMTWHRKLRYAGRLDKIALIPRWKEHKGLIDVKSATAMPRTIGPQTAAYLEAEISGENPMRLTRRTPRAGVLLRPDGTYSFHPCKPSEHARDFNYFVSGLNIYRWRSRT